MSDKPKLQCTRNYDLFESNTSNRRLHGDRGLFASMKKTGWDPAHPAHVVRRPSGKLGVIAGHNRLDCAKRLGLVVWYVVSDVNTDLNMLEGGGHQQWSGSDFLVYRANDPAEDPLLRAACARVLEFARAHGLNVGTAASLLGGETAGSGNMIPRVKDRSFKLAEDQSHAQFVVDITDYCHKSGIVFARTAAFVAAVSMSVHVPQFDPAVFIHRVSQNPALMRKRSTRDEYLEEIEALYNHAARAGRLPLAYSARELSRIRAGNFGRPRSPKTPKLPVPAKAGVSRAIRH